MSQAAAIPLANLWDEAHAAGLDEPGRLLYRSNLLGGDLRITNFGGGNTSAKIDMADPLTGEPVRTLWVKGSGGDLGSMKRDGFATLYLDRLESLKGRYRGLAHEDEMVGLFNHCTFDLNPRAASIDTPLHAFVPHAHVDHVHADAVIAIAASSDAEALTRKVFGGALGFLAWQRPGFDLGLKLGEMAAANPGYVGVVLGGHGLFTWGETSKACYETTLRVIQQAADWLAANEPRPAFGGARVEPAAPARRREIAARLTPLIRGEISRRRAQGRAFHRRAGGARIRQLAGVRHAGAARNFVPRPFPAHQDPPADAALRSGERRSRGARQFAQRAARSLSRRLRRLLPALQARQFAGDARSQRGDLSRSRASACCPSPGTRRPRGSPPNSTSTRSTSCAAPRASPPMSACPSRRLSTSNTGCSRKPSCSACRSPNRSPAASPMSPAARAASAGRRRCGC